MPDSNHELANYLQSLHPQIKLARLTRGQWFAGIILLGIIFLCLLFSGIYDIASGNAFPAEDSDLTLMVSCFIIFAAFGLLLYASNHAAMMLAAASLVGWSVTLLLSAGQKRFPYGMSFNLWTAILLALILSGAALARWRIVRTGRPITAPLLGYIAQALGVLGFVGILGALWIVPTNLFMMFPAWVASSLFMLSWGQSLRQPTAFDLLRKDLRAPILYLRNFRRDDLVGVEQELCALLGERGPVVGIGRPGEKISRTGAARFFVDNDHWQEAVIRVVGSASLVVMFMGESVALEWEVTTLTRIFSPEKLVLYLPTLRRMNYRVSAYEGFRRRFETLFPKGLPPNMGVATLIAFTADWTPRLLPNGGKVSPGFADTGDHHLRAALQVVFEFGPVTGASAP